MMKHHTDALTNDYKILMNFIYQGEEWVCFQQSRLEPHVTYRHIVRALILRERKPFLEELCVAEGDALQKTAPNHATLINSKHRFEDEISISRRAFVYKISMFYSYHLQKDASPMGEGIIEIAKRLYSNTPEMNSFLLARCFKAGFLLPQEQTDWIQDYTTVGQEFLEQMLNDKRY